MAQKVYLMTDEQMERIVELLCKDNRNASSQNIAKVINELGRLPSVSLCGAEIVPRR